MCQLLGMNGNTPTDIVFSFTGFATRAVEHKDGFGIAFFEGPGVRCLRALNRDVELRGDRVFFRLGQLYATQLGQRYATRLGQRYANGHATRLGQR